MERLRQSEGDGDESWKRPKVLLTKSLNGKEGYDGGGKCTEIERDEQEKNNRRFHACLGGRVGSCFLNPRESQRQLQSSSFVCVCDIMCHVLPSHSANAAFK